MVWGVNLAHTGCVQVCKVTGLTKQQKEPIIFFMSVQEKGIVNRERLVVESISALYTDTQDPTIQRFIQKSRENMAVEFPVASPEEISTEDLAEFILDYLDYRSEIRKGIHLRALRHAKGVLVSQKRSPERDERLHKVSQRLSELTTV